MGLQEHFERVLSTRYISFKKSLIELVEKNIWQQSMILDAGCGSGETILALTQNTQGIGVDINRERIRDAHKSSKALKKLFSFLIADVEKIPFRSKIFDIIICSFVLEHLRNPEKAIEQFASVLKVNGKLYVTTSDAFSPMMLIDRMLPERWLFKFKLLNALRISRDRRFYLINHPLKLKRTLVNCGFRLEKFSYVGVPQIRKSKRLLYLWALSNVLTDVWPLNILKESIFVVARNSKSHS